MSKCKFLCLLFLATTFGPNFAQTTQVQFTSTVGPCSTGAAARCSVSDNRVWFYATTQNPDTVDPLHPDILPRFKAFWITGDGNYLGFEDTDTDQESLQPTSPYNYSKPGDYIVSVYLTGKYTNHHPPPGAARTVNVPAPASPAGYPYPAAGFNQRSGSGDFDLFPMHKIRKDYLTPIVLSYKASLEKTWNYLFFNGKSTGAAWPDPSPLQFRKDDCVTPNYFSGDRSKLNAYSSDLLEPGEISIDGITFVPQFRSLKNRYADVVYFPMETTPAATLPTGFSKKRYFPVFWADTSAVIGTADSLLSFLYIVTGPQPLPEALQGKLREQLNSMQLDLPIGSPINQDGGFESADRLKFNKIQQPQSLFEAQYIQGIYSTNIDYVAAHDPNQLTVVKIDKISDGRFKVTFHLEMCNKGRGPTRSQVIDLFDRFGKFSNYNYNGSAVTVSATAANHYLMTSNLPIDGIPDNEYAMQCKSIEFTAETDCNGVRSLWKGNTSKAFEVCVRFAEVDETECGGNMPIDSCEFKIDNKCFCDQPPSPCGGEGWLLVFLLLFVFILLVWKHYSDKANGI